MKNLFFKMLILLYKFAVALNLRLLEFRNNCLHKKTNFELIGGNRKNFDLIKMDDDSFYIELMTNLIILKL